MSKKLAIASDHAGFELKEFVKKEFPEFIWFDLGPTNTNRVDYPDFAKSACEKLLNDNLDGAVLICGSGIGMSIAANKIHGIRAAVVESKDAARLSKEHNNANVLCIGARLTKPSYAKELIISWINANFEGGRHSDRVKKIADLEK